MLFYSNFHSCFQIPPLASGRSSDSSGLSDSTFLILQLFSTEECCSLSFSLTLSVLMSSSSILSSCFPDFQIIKRPARDACLCMGELPAPPAPPAPHFVFLITL